MGERMTVGNLIEALQNLPADSVVFMAGDREGNEFDFVDLVCNDGDAYEFSPRDGSPPEVYENAITIFPADARYRIEQLDREELTSP